MHAVRSTTVTYSVIMSAMASQISGASIFYSTVCSRKMFPFDDVIVVFGIIYFRYIADEYSILRKERVFQSIPIGIKYTTRYQERAVPVGQFVYLLLIRHRHWSNQEVYGQINHRKSSRKWYNQIETRHNKTTRLFYGTPCRFLWETRLYKPPPPPPPPPPPLMQIHVPCTSVRRVQCSMLILILKEKDCHHFVVIWDEISTETPRLSYSISMGQCKNDVTPLLTHWSPSCTNPSRNKITTSEAASD